MAYTTGWDMLRYLFLLINNKMMYMSYMVVPGIIAVYWWTLVIPVVVNAFPNTNHFHSTLSFPPIRLIRPSIVSNSERYHQDTYCSDHVSATMWKRNRSYLLLSFTSAPSTSALSIDDEIKQATEVLERAAISKSEDPDNVYEALVSLEQKMRQKAKNDDTVAVDMLQQLHGDWQLVFTTGTKKTQSQWLGGGRINYFPLKAVQTFRTQIDTTVDDAMKITNAIYFGDTWIALQFLGTMDFDLKKRRLSFDFDQLKLLNGLFTIDLAPGQARDIGSSSGLGSKGQTQKQSAFFNWISANKDIATARGGGGGLALWKRVG
jgi:hypothetical protein